MTIRFENRRRNIAFRAHRMLFVPRLPPSIGGIKPWVAPDYQQEER
jgi:hypothetical protein